MVCPACSRPIAMARANCVYCGAALSSEAIAGAAQASQKVLQSKNLLNLEAAATARVREQASRRYLIIDTASAPVERLAEACSVSAWEARQWQAASRYRLLKISTEPANGEFESGLRERGLVPLVVPDDTIARSRNPVLIESMDPNVSPLQCSLREDPEAAPSRRELREQDVMLILSASIKRERVKDQAPSRARADTRLEDAWLIHLHVVGEPRPWEIDPLRTSYEGPGLASAFMRTLELVRRLSTLAPHDESFRNIVPALSPGADPLRELQALAPAAKKKAKEPKVVVLDNVAQFREYSAWRGAVEAMQRLGARPPS
ncbi:MAG: hypothetical protein ABI565_04260 [Vicinamibacteria bacterium]